MSQLNKDDALQQAYEEYKEKEKEYKKKYGKSPDMDFQEWLEVQQDYI